MNRCAARGCGRWTRAGEEFCARHGEADEPLQDGQETEPGLAHFRDRLLAGDYEALLGAGLRDTLRGAATDSGLDAEIGALRLALARLLQEERDPSRLATGVARVAGVAVQAVRLRQSADGQGEALQDVMAQTLAAMEAEQEAAARAEQEGGADDADR